MASRLHRRAATLAILLAAISNLIVTAFQPSPPRHLRGWFRTTRLSATAATAAAAEGPKTAEDFAPGWVARTLPADSLRGERLELAAKAPDWTTKLIDVTIERSEESPGLGIMLEEFGVVAAAEAAEAAAAGNGVAAAGGAAGAGATAGAGLTLVTGLVEGGNAAAAVGRSEAGSAIMPGDTIVSAGGVRLEALDYDSTVAALGSLPPAPEPVALTVRRLVRIPSVKCTVCFPPEENKPDRVVRLYPGQKLQRAFILSGILGKGCNDDLQCLRTCGVAIYKGGKLLEEKQTQERLMLENRNEPRW
jgi:hypothetical protein